MICEKCYPNNLIEGNTKLSQFRINNKITSDYQFFKNDLSNLHTRGEEYKLKIHQIANNGMFFAGKKDSLSLKPKKIYK